jgi:hypothetical protein
MGLFSLFGQKKKKKALVKPKTRAKQKTKQKAVVESDVKFAHIMKEFGVLQKELKDVKRALGMLKQAEERTFAEVQDNPIKLSAVIEREIGELSRKMDELVLKAPRIAGGAPDSRGKTTPLMSSIIEVLGTGSMRSGDIYRKLLENDVRVHEKSIPRALRGLINQGLVRVNSDSGGYKYEKTGKED